MGVIDKSPKVGPEKNKDGLYIFSSRPITPGERGSELLVRFQAVSKTQPCLSYQYISVNSATRLSVVRRHIARHFRGQFERGFIFIGKNVEILKSSERDTKVFDILPKIPQIHKVERYGCIKNKWVLPNENFRYPDVQYQKVAHEYDGKRYIVLCACVIYLFEQSKVSHWSPNILREELSGNVYEGFSFIPTDILSWNQHAIDSRAPLLHKHAATGKREELEVVIQQLPQGTIVQHICDERGYSPLHYAAENGQLDVCEALVAGIGKSLLYHLDIQGKSPLHCALYRKRCNIITYLLQMESDLLRKDAFGNSCLALLQLLKDSDLDYIISKLEFQYVDKYLQFFLAYCILRKKTNKTLGLKISASLHKYQSDIFSVISIGASLLHLSAGLDKQITENILRKGFPKLERDITGLLPFHNACKWGMKFQVQLLYDQNMTDDDMRLGLQLALQFKRYGLCQTISELRTNLELDETTVCMILEILNRSLAKQRKQKFEGKFKIWEVLAKQLLPVIAKEKDALNMYVFDAAYHGLADTLVLLKKLNADFRSTDLMGRTPIHEASQGNHTDCLMIMLKTGADPNATDWRNATPLHYSSEKGHLDAVKLLLANGANASAQDDAGRNPLMTSVYRKRMTVTKYLLNHESVTDSITAVDCQGQTILHYTPFMNVECVDILLDKLDSYKGMIGTRSKGSTENQTLPTNISWNIEQRQKDFTLNFVVQHEKIPQNKIKWKPFQWVHNTELWKSRSTNNSSNVTKCKSPQMSSEICSQCKVCIRNKKHVCHKLWEQQSQSNTETNVQENIGAFKFHAGERKFCLPPIHIAVRRNQVELVKKLIRFDSKCVTATDEHNRNVLEYAIDQGSQELIKQLLDLSSVLKTKSLVHRVIMSNTIGCTENAKSILKYLLSIDCVHDRILDPVKVTHENSEGSYKPESFYLCQDYLKSYTPLEVAIEKQNYTLFKLILDKYKSSNVGLALHFAVYFGSPAFLEALEKKRQKSTWDNKNITNIHDLHRIDYVYAIHILCCSPFVNVEIMRLLFKCHPDITKNKHLVDLTDENFVQIRPHFVKTSPFDTAARTPLAKLLSPSHPCMKNTKRKGILDSVGTFMVESGIYLGTYSNPDENGKPIIHCACEALLNAMESEHFQSAIHILHSAGNIVWRCSLTNDKCCVHEEFRKRQDENCGKEIFADIYIKHIFTLACRKNVPDYVLLSLLDTGNSFLKDNKEPLVEFDSSSNTQYVKGTLQKLVGCVLDIVMSGRIKKGNCLKLLRQAPAIFPVLSNLEQINFESLPTDEKEMKLLRTCARIMCSTSKPECIQVPTGTSLLHFACATGNLNFVKMIHQAPLPPVLNQKNENGVRAIDVAAACGHMFVVKYLLDEGASFTSDILIATCKKESYMGIGLWTRQLVTAPESDKSEKMRTKLVKELVTRKEININYQHKKYGSAVACAVANGLDEVVQILGKECPSALHNAMNNERNVAENVSRCHETTILNILTIIGRNITRLSSSSIGQLLLHIAANSTDRVLEQFTNMLSRALNCETWVQLLAEKDKHGRTALHFVASKGNIFAADTLSRHVHICVADVEDLSGTTPLWQALTHQHWKIAEIFLIRGSNPIFSRAVPGLCVRRMYGGTDLNNNTSVLHSDYETKQRFGRKMFPHFINISPGVSPCLAPGKERIKNKLQTKRKKECLFTKKQSDDFQLPCQILQQSSPKSNVVNTLALSRICRKIGCSLIHFACYTGSLGLLKKILQFSGMSTFEDDVYGLSPFIHAVVGGHFTLLEKELNDHKQFSAECMLKAVTWKVIKTYSSCKDIQKAWSSLLQKLLGEKVEEIPNETPIPLLSVKMEKFINEVNSMKYSFPVFVDGHTVSEDYLQKTLTFSLDHISDKYCTEAIILLTLVNKTWIVKSIVDASLKNDCVRETLEKPLIGNHFFLDLIISCTKHISDVSSIPEEMVQNIEDIQRKYAPCENINILELAALKGFWIYLTPIARYAFEQDQNMVFTWRKILCLGAKTGQLIFLKSLIDMVSISKLDRRIKTCFTGYLCMAAISGQTDVVKYLLRQGTPLTANTSDPIFVELLKQFHTNDWGLLQYAVKGNEIDTIDIIVKFCRHDKDFMKICSSESVFSLVASMGNSVVMKMMVKLFLEYTGRVPTTSIWNDYFLSAAKKGFESLCIYILDETDVDITCRDNENQTVLHFCAQRNLLELTKKLVEKFPSLTESLDLRNMKPIDYAYAVGNLSLAGMLSDVPDTQPSQDFNRIECYGWFPFVLNQNETVVHKHENDYSKKKVSRNRHLDLWSLLKKSEDHVAATIIHASKYQIKQFITAELHTYGKLFHVAARYGCKQSLQFLCDLMKNDQEMMKRIFRITYEGFIPLAWAIISKEVECIEMLSSYDTCCDWRSPTTGENILHLAVKSQSQSIVDVVFQFSQELLRENDNNRCSPLLCVAALGLPKLFSTLLPDGNVETEEHKSHTYEDLQYHCVNCILDHAIGWSKLYQEHGEDLPKCSIRSIENITELKATENVETNDVYPIFAKTFWQHGENSPITAAVMAAMGYQSDPKSVLKAIAFSQYPPQILVIKKLLCRPEFPNVLPELLKHGIDANRILEIAITKGTTAIFVAMSSHMLDFNSSMKSQFGISLYEMVIGLAKYHLLPHLQNILNMEMESFDAFHELYEILPQKILWASKIESPEDVLSSDDFQNDHTMRLSKADIWLASSTDKNFVGAIEIKTNSSESIKDKINGKKYSVDFESFRKHDCLSDKSDFWIQCLFVSSLIFGEIKDKLSLDESKIKSSTSVKVACIKGGTSEHPKTVVDNNGCLTEAVGLVSFNGNVYVQHDGGMHQHLVECALKDDIQNHILPDIREIISKEFGLNINVRIDWGAIEMKKRTSNAGLILKALSGELFGNRLGGFEDTLKDCIDMKNDIKAMFNEQTVALALEPVTAVKEIVISLNDHRSTNGSQWNKKAILRTWKWHFNIEKSTLQYDRTSLPLWNCLNFYRGACVSVCSAIFSLSKLNTGKFIHSTQKNTGEVTLQIDGKSFGITDDYVLHKLLCQDVAREIHSITYHCQSMMRLHINVNHILIKNVAAVQYSGYTVVNNIGVLSVCSNNSVNKNWYVEQSNAQIKLAELEDKQLLNEWTSQKLEYINDAITECQKDILKETGISVQVSVDEKRMLSSAFSKCRRELTHPHTLVKDGLVHTVSNLPKICSDFIRKSLHYSQTTSTREINPLQCTNGPWVASRLETLAPINTLLKTIALSQLKPVFPFEKERLPQLRQSQKQFVTAGKDPKNVDSKTTMVSASWEQMISNDTSTTAKRVGVFTYNNRVFEFMDNSFNTAFGKIPRKLCIAHNVVESLEYHGIDFTADKLHLEIDVKHDGLSNFAMHLHDLYSQKVINLIPIKNIDVNWKSFMNGNRIDLCAYQICMASFVDTVYDVCRREKECSFKNQIKRDIQNVFSEIEGITIQMEIDRLQTDIERSVRSRKESGKPSIYVLKNGKILIEFSENFSQNPFTDILHVTIVHLLELGIKNNLQIRNISTEEDRVDEVTTSHTLVNTTKRPHYELCLGNKAMMVTTLDILRHQILEVDEKLASSVYNFIFARSTTGNKITLKNGVLVVHLSTVYEDIHRFAAEVLRVLEIQHSCSTLTILPEFKFGNSSIFFANDKENILSLQIHNVLGDNSEQFLSNISNSERYKLHIYGFTSSIKRETEIASPPKEIGIQTITVETPNQISLKWDGKLLQTENVAKMELLFDNKVIECTRLPLFTMRSQLPQSHFNSPKYGHINVSKDHSFRVALLHSTTTISSPERNEMTKKSTQSTKRLSSVEFDIQYENKHFPSASDSNPVCIEMLGYKGCHVYRFRVVDSKRMVSVRAVCSLCQKPYQLATQFWVLNPGQAIIINDSYI